MEGPIADNVRPPQPRSSSIAQTVHSQAPTLPSIQKSNKETNNEIPDSSEATPSDHESIRADHAEDPIDEQTPETLTKAGQLLSKPAISPDNSPKHQHEKQEEHQKSLSIRSTGRGWARPQRKIDKTGITDIEHKI